MYTCEYCQVNTNDSKLCRECHGVLCSYCVEKRHDRFYIHEPRPWINDTECCFCTENYKKRIFRDEDVTKFLLKMAKGKLREKYNVDNVTLTDIKDILYKNMRKQAKKSSQK